MTPSFPQLTASEVLDGLSLAVIGLNAQLRVEHMNPAAEVLFGVSAGFASGEEIHTVMPMLMPILGRVVHALTEGEAFTERELRVQGPGGHNLTLDITATPIRSAHLDGILLEVMPRDRHLRISRDNQLWKQQKISQELIRGLAHEIKNPLGGLRGAAQLLARQINEPALAEFTDVIINEADRLQALVDRLLGPNTPPAMRRLNAHQVMEHVRTLLTAQAPRQVSIQRDYDPSLPPLRGDAEQLIQAVLNIAVNALQAVGDSGEVMLRTRSQRQFTIAGRRHRYVLRLDISDNGPGITPHMLEQIFYPMVTTRPEGTGLGLAIAQNLIHAHGGLIECDSHPGSTTFSIFLPVDDAHVV